MLSLVGSYLYAKKYPTGALSQTANLRDSITFEITDKVIGGEFAEYWKQHGGMDQFGYPISNEFEEEQDGQVYLVQYFERAKFEHHKEVMNGDKIMLALLGRELFDDKYLPDAKVTPRP
jgi:hypothetical protein